MPQGSLDMESHEKYENHEFHEFSHFWSALALSTRFRSSRAPRQRAMFEDRRNLQRWTSVSNTPARQIGRRHDPKKRRKNDHKFKDISKSLLICWWTVETRVGRTSESIVWTKRELSVYNIGGVMPQGSLGMEPREKHENYENREILNFWGSRARFKEDFAWSAPLPRNVQVTRRAFKL